MWPVVLAREMLGLSIFLALAIRNKFAISFQVLEFLPAYRPDQQTYSIQELLRPSFADAVFYGAGCSRSPQRYSEVLRPWTLAASDPPQESCSTALEDHCVASGGWEASAHNDGIASYPGSRTRKCLGGPGPGVGRVGSRSDGGKVKSPSFFRAQGARASRVGGGSRVPGGFDPTHPPPTPTSRRGPASHPTNCGRRRPLRASGPGISIRAGGGDPVRPVPFRPSRVASRLRSPPTRGHRLTAPPLLGPTPLTAVPAGPADPRRARGASRPAAGAARATLAGPARASPRRAAPDPPGPPPA